MRETERERRSVISEGDSQRDSNRQKEREGREQRKTKKERE